MLQNAYFLAKIGADTAENEQHFAENLPKIGNYPTGPSGPEPVRTSLSTAACGRHATSTVAAQEQRKKCIFVGKMHV